MKSYTNNKINKNKQTNTSKQTTFSSQQNYQKWTTPEEKESTVKADEDTICAKKASS